MVGCIIQHHDGVGSPVPVLLVENSAKLDQKENYCLAIVLAFVQGKEELVLATHCCNDANLAQTL